MVAGRRFGPGAGPVALYWAKPAHRHARKRVEQEQHSLPNGAADVFEINIDPIRTGSYELFGKVRYAMINNGIEAKFFDDRAAFFRAAGDADSSCASQLGELPNQ